MTTKQFYRVYSIHHPGAVEQIEADNSFAARKAFRDGHPHSEITDIVAIRTDEKWQPMFRRERIRIDD